MGVEGFYMVVYGGICDYHTPKMFFFTQVEAFFKNFLSLDPDYVILRMEA